MLNQILDAYALRNVLAKNTMQVGFLASLANCSPKSNRWLTKLFDTLKASNTGNTMIVMCLVCANYHNYCPQMHNSDLICFLFLMFGVRDRAAPRLAFMH